MDVTVETAKPDHCEDTGEGRVEAEKAIRNALGLAASIPTPAALDQQLAQQRLFLIRICTIPMVLFGTLWAALLVSGVLGEPDGGFHNVHIIPPIFLVAIGLASYRFGNAGRVQAAAYTLITALTLIATTSMIAIANAEFTCVITYTVTLSVAAMILDTKQLARVAVVLVTAAMVAVLLHHYPVIEQIELPQSLTIVSVIAATVLGLPYPMVMFWMFSNSLSNSREEAWRAARVASDAAQIIDQRTEELERAAEQSRAKNSELTDFLYVVSHDMRAPLINLDGFSQALRESLAELGTLERATGTEDTLERRTRIEADIDESLGFIQRSVKNMDFLVRAVLELSRLETRAAAIQPVDTAAVVAEVLSSRHREIDQRKVCVEANALPEIQADPVRIHQVFTNLLDNALKYLKPEGPARIEVRCREDIRGFEFTVRDNGVGIRPEDHARIFRLFTRVGHPNAAGDGIGLTLVRKIIEKEGGRIWVESTLGEGTAFHFTWPRLASPLMEVPHDTAA